MRGVLHWFLGCPANQVKSTDCSIECKCGAHWWKDQRTGQWIDHQEKDYREYGRIL